MIDCLKKHADPKCHGHSARAVKKTPNFTKENTLTEAKTAMLSPAEARACSAGLGFFYRFKSPYIIIAGPIKILNKPSTHIFIIHISYAFQGQYLLRHTTLNGRPCLGRNLFSIAQRQTEPKPYPVVDIFRAV